MQNGLVVGLSAGAVPDVAVGDAGQNALMSAGARREVPFSTTTVQALGPWDCSNYRWMSMQITGQGGSSTVTWQVSNDGVNWKGLSLLSTVATGSSGDVPVLSATATGMWVGPILGRFLRLNVTGIASGTTAGVLELLAVPPPTIMTAIASLNSTALSSGGLTIQAASTPADTLNPGSGSSLFVIGMGSAYNGTNWDRLRTPTTFKSVAATGSGNTTLWIPTSAKKFRLMRLLVVVTADAATSGGADIDVTFQDSSTDLGFKTSVFVPSAAGTTFGAGFSTGWVDLGNGKLSAAANNVLSVNLSATLSSGKCTAFVAGTEE